ncbi:MAG: EAL domain-containing protein [Burkholderiales bacterium]|nr:EAL domain-containing protein [Burkholderiales bacterium]MDE2504804.1 EAL domain-containing protein [Burkholderiales bacterium]
MIASTLRHGRQIWLRWVPARVGAGYSFPEFEDGTRMPGRLRLLMIVIFLAWCLAAAIDYAGLHAVEDARRGDLAVLNLAGRQRMWSQRAAQLAARLAQGRDRQSLTAALAQAVQELALDRGRLLELPRFAAIAGQVPSIAPLLEAARAALQAAAQPVPSPEAGLAAATSVAAAADAFLPRMDAALTALQRSTEQDVADTERAHARHMLALLTLVSVLALGSGEWLARRMARQHERMRQQAQELERLALVAERTDNAVIIADAQGRMTWANDAFTRISGHTLQEALGKKPGTLLQFEGTDPATRAELRDAIAAHRPVQVQILNRAKQGRLYWLHLDLQPLTDDAGRCTGFVAVETDITAHVMEQTRLESLLRALPAGVVQQDAQGRITDANPEACRILGLKHAQLLGRESVDPRWHTVHEDGTPFPGHEHPAMQALRSGVAVRGVAMGVSMPGGERRWLRINAEPIHGPDGSLVSAVSSFVDITETSSQRRLLTLTVDAAGLGTWDWNVPAGEVTFNDRWWQMLGYQPGELPSALSIWEALMHPQDLPGARRALQRHFDDPAEPYRCEFRMRRADGSWAWIMAAGSAIERQPGGPPQRMAGIHLDITQRKSLEQRLADAALTDALTGLPNRAALQARLAKCAARAQRDGDYLYAVLFMDFDRFKQVNDSLGHEAGDELLRQIAQRLRATLRPGDDLARLDSGEHTAARLGGDEFVALLEPLRRPDDATAVAQRLLDALSAPYALAGQEVCSTVSIGIVTSERADRDPETLLRDADTAMYEAKRRGRARYVVFSEDMHERVRQALDLEADLRRALRTPGEVFVAYQPIVDLATGAICGAEALARWNHPTRGPVSPVEFIPLAEENGLIAELGEQVLQAACSDAVAWRQTLGARSIDTVSVNLSRAQIRKGGLPARVAAILAGTGLPPRALRLEITESLAMQDPQMVATLHELRALGVSLALDDFGTGYSSLASLDQLPLDAVKIDRGFVQRMVGDQYQTALIEATLRVAASLHLEVVAEGVETEEQARLLRRAGCSRAQGWLFGRPMAAADLAARLSGPAERPDRAPRSSGLIERPDRAGPTEPARSSR